MSKSCSQRLLRALFLVSLITTGCKPDPSTMSEENERLREQVAKQESMVSSIQDGYRFLQEQTRVLTQEVREDKKEVVRPKAERNAAATKLEAYVPETRKLSRDNQLMTPKKGQADQILRVEDKDSQSEE